MDDEELEELDEAFTSIENMVLIEAGKFVFDELDVNDNGEVDFDEFTGAMEEFEEDLDEDDMDLIEENLGVKIEKKRKRIMMITSDTKEAPLMKARMVVT